MPEIRFSPETASTSSRWREFWAKDTGANLSSYKIADEARPTQEFRRKIEKSITQEEQQFVETAGADSLTQILTDSLDDAKGRREKHARNQQTIGKIGKAALSFANNFSSFLQAYSGIVEIMQGADQQYGGVAYSALSLLLIVAVNKQRKEEHIDAALLTLQREFARVKMLREVHSSDSMKAYIAEAYKLGIDFVRGVTLYYSRSTYRRVFEAITKPPQLGIDLQISAITNAIAEIEKERATLDSQRLFQVQASVEDAKKGVEDAKKGVEALHKQTEHRNLALLKEKLLLGEKRDPNDILAQYSSELGAAFRNIQRLQTFNFERLVQEESYIAWDTSRASCMMLLHGRTAVTKTEYSWLSPAIFQLIARCRTQKRPVIFHLCQSEPFMEKDVPAHVVLSSLICQLLDEKASILRDEAKYQELDRKFSDPDWCAAQPRMPATALHELLDLFSDMHILLDRVDRIRGDAQAFMTLLANLVKECRGSIKVFLVSSSNRYNSMGGKISAEVQESVEYDLGSERFRSLEWNQR